MPWLPIVVTVDEKQRDEPQFPYCLRSNGVGSEREKSAGVYSQSNAFVDTASATSWPGKSGSAHIPTIHLKRRSTLVWVYRCVIFSYRFFPNINFCTR